MDLNVRQRLATLRRNFLTLGWASRSGSDTLSRAPQEADRDLILEDHHPRYDGIGADGGIDWHRENPGLYDDDPNSPTPSPEARAAIFRLAEKIRAEGEALVDYSARARREADQLLRAHAGAAARAAGLLGGNKKAASEAYAQMDEFFSVMNELVREMGTTALSAALSAVRAGASTRGFGQVAKGIDELERALRAAWEEVDDLIGLLEDRAAETAATAAQLRMAGKAMAERTNALPSSVRTHGKAESGASGQLEALAGLTQRIATTAEDVAAACDEMAGIIRTLAEKLVIVVRETPVGDRRGSRRHAFEASCILTTSEHSFPGRTLDISSAGALVKLRHEPAMRRGQPITIHLKDIPPIIGTVAGLSSQGVHLAFDLGHTANAEARPYLSKMLDSLAVTNQDLVNRVSHLAREIRQAMDRGISEGAISPEALLDPVHEPIPDTSPPRYTHPALAFCEAFLSPILERAVRDGPRIAHALVMDRAGLVVACRPGADDDSRRSDCLQQGRIFSDAPSQRAARNLRPFHIETIRRDAVGDGEASAVRSVSVPVFLGGRHWGCAEIGFPMEDGDATLAALEV